MTLKLNYKQAIQDSQSLLKMQFWLPEHPRYRRLYNLGIRASLIIASQHGDLSALNKLIYLVPNKEFQRELEQRLCSELGFTIKTGTLVYTSTGENQKRSVSFKRDDDGKRVSMQDAEKVRTFSAINKAGKTTTGIKLDYSNLSFDELFETFLDTLVIYRKELSSDQIDELKEVVERFASRHIAG